MSFQPDPKAPWRSTVFSGVTVRYIVVPDSPRHYDPIEADDDVATGVDGLRDWLDSTERWAPARGEARIGLSSGRMTGVYEVGDIRDTCALNSEAVVESNTDYEYFDKQTRLVATTDGYHYRAAPDLNAAAVNSMLNSQSVEEYARTAGFKLPRITAADSSSTPDPLGTAAEESGMLVNRFEALRGKVGDHASQDDYGFRLHSLARIVLHSVVVKESARVNKKRKAMSERDHMRSVLTASLPMVRPEGLERCSWWYIGSELSPLYRAFLVMGARGLQHYADANSVYAALVSEPEVSLPESTNIVFTRKTGQLLDSEVAPHVDDYMRVLDNPELALSFYNAYAQSIGLVHEASEVLLQTAIGPFVWGEVATMPYRSASPKMDGAAYLFTENTSKAHFNILNVESLVARAALTGKGYLAGAAALVGSFKRTGKTLTSDVLARTMGALSDGVQARTLSAEVWACLAGCSASLEWVHPFDNVQVGVSRCMRAFRASGWLIAWYNCAPAAALDGVFDRGVQMSGGVVGEKGYRGNHYRETLIFQLARGRPLQLMSESYAQAVLTPAEYQAMGNMKSWLAVCRPVRFAAREKDKPSAKPTAEQHLTELGEEAEEVSASLQFLRAVPGTDTGSVGATTVRAPGREQPGGGRPPAANAAVHSRGGSSASSGPKPPEPVSPQSQRSGGSRESAAPGSVPGRQRSSPSQASMSVSGRAL